MDNKLFTPGDEKGRWIHEGRENKLHPRYLICEFIDNSIEHSNRDEELNIEIVWNQNCFCITDNANGITDWETSLKRYSKELKNSKSEYNVGMKDAIQFFGMQAIIYSSSNQGKKAYYINAHFEEDDPKCTWKDNEVVIAWDEYDHTKISYEFEQYGTLIHVFDLHENRKNNKKIKELSPKNFKRLMHFIGTRYYRDFINRNINITFDFFGEKETINALFIKSRLIPTEYFTIRQKKDLLHFQNKEHTWNEMILERLNDINDSIYIGEKYKKEFKSIEGFKSSLSFFNILSLDGSSYSIEDLWKPFSEPREDNYPVLKWEFIWETNLNDYLDEKMQFHIKLGIPTRIGQKNKMKYQNTPEDFGISIYQHNRGIHIMEKSLKKKPWINEFTNQVGSGIMKLENFELEFHFPKSPKIRTGKNKIYFNDELIQIIKECFMFEVYTKMSLCHITLLGHSLKMNSKIRYKWNRR